MELVIVGILAAIFIALSFWVNSTADYHGEMYKIYRTTKWLHSKQSWDLAYLFVMLFACVFSAVFIAALLGWIPANPVK